VTFDAGDCRPRMDGADLFFLIVVLLIGALIAVGLLISFL
jgi:hypothetical protein